MQNIDEIKQKLPQTISLEGKIVRIIDQRQLPQALVMEDLKNVEDAARAIKDMHTRGAQAIGATGIAGMILAAEEFSRDYAQAEPKLKEAAELLLATRPTAVNLSWGVKKMLKVAQENPDNFAKAMWKSGQEILTSEIENNLAIGEHGAKLIKDGMALQTHCNGGSLSSIWYGTQSAPYFTAWRQGKKISLIIDETRPRLQGARLTAWEAKQLGIPFQVVTDSSCGALLGGEKVDAVIVGADRIAANGDVANKIGTYPLALMAHEHGIPFYVAAVEATIDPDMPNGQDIPIEERSQAEFWEYVDPEDVDSSMPALNIAFDVTPAKYVTKIITEKGIKDPSKVLE